MEVDDDAYQEACTKLSYIKKVKQELCTLLDWLTDGRNSRMYVSARDFDRACAVINETIDDMFYEEIHYAKTIRDHYE